MTMEMRTDRDPKRATLGLFMYEYPEIRKLCEVKHTVCSQIQTSWNTYLVITILQHLLMQKLQQLIQLTEKQSLCFPVENNACRKHFQLATK
jgi:hypothetical protein